MRFDSHILALLEAAVGLVNGLTPGQAQGRPFEVPTPAERAARIADLLETVQGKPRLRHQDTAHLVEVAGRLRTVFAAADRRDLGDAAGAVNGLLRDYGARPQLDLDPLDGWNVHFHGSDDSLVVGWTAGCASALALAVGSELAGRLGVCGATRCDRVYVDTSRNAARRFCSTSCQNRTKAAAFRQRQGVGG